MNFGILGNVTEEEMKVAVEAIENKRRKDNIENLEKEFSNFLYQLAEQKLHICINGGAYMRSSQPLALDSRNFEINGWRIY